MEKYQYPPLDAQPSTLLIDLQYLPCLDFFAGLLTFDTIRIEAAEQYQKQSYRNRCYVLTANKIDCLTVPVQQGTHKQRIRDVRIDYQQSWTERHWRCLQAAYGKAPFFDYVAPDIEPVLRKSWSFLFDLNYELLTICLHWLRITKPIFLTEWYEKQPESGVFDARSQVKAKNQAGGYRFYRPVSYMQNFGLDFVPNLSLLDLLFCQGPSARDVLQSSLLEEQTPKKYR